MSSAEKSQTQSIWPFLDETILLCMKHYKTCFRFLICEQIRLGLELKAFEPLAVQGSRRDAHLCSPFTFEQQSRRGDGRFSFALIPATKCSKNCTKLEQFNTNIIDHFICCRTFRICSDLTFAMAARALVDIFNGLDNATERRGVQTSLQLSPHPSASKPLVLSKVRQSFSFFFRRNHSDEYCRNPSTIVW